MSRLWLVVALLVLGCKQRAPSAASGLNDDRGPSANAASEMLWMLDGAEVDTPESVYHAGDGVLFVANMAGGPGDKDGRGWISRFEIDPETGALRSEPRRWLDGLNSPKGMRHAGNLLWVTDMTEVHAVAMTGEAGRTQHVVKVPGAIALNDSAVDGAGNVFVSDIAGGKIFVIRISAKGEPAVETLTTAVASPNGLLVEGGKLYALQWGAGETDPKDFSTSEPGSLWSIELQYGNSDALPTAGAVKKLAVAPRAGIAVGRKRNLDGVERFGDGFLLTDFIGGAVERLRPALEPSAFEITDEIRLPSGGAGDLTVVRSNDGKGCVVVPLSFAAKRAGAGVGAIVAYPIGG